jgi:hypothetical protein
MEVSMAKDVGKPGLTTFGWLALLGAGAAYFSNKGRRDKALNQVKGFTDRFGGTAAGSDTATTTTGQQA